MCRKVARIADGTVVARPPAYKGGKSMSKLSMVWIVFASVGCATDDARSNEVTDPLITSVTAGTLYDQGNQGLPSFTVTASSSGLWTDANLPPSFDNIASSLSVNPNCGVQVFVDANQGGSSELYEAGNTTLLVPIFPIGIDNQVSSYRAYCRPQCRTGT